MSDEIELPNEKELKKLPRYSMAVYAIRCALRVQPLLALLKKPSTVYKQAIVTLNREYRILVYSAAYAHAARARARAAAEAAYDAARATRAARAAAAATADATEATAYAYDATEAAARAAATDAGADYAAEADADYARAAATAVEVATDSAANYARATAAAARAAAAADAADAAYYARAAAATDAAARADYARLKELKTEVTDASETGPLGDLWHGSPPEWYLKAKANYDKTIAEWERELKEESPEDRARRYEESDPEPLISVYFDDSDFTKEEMVLFLKYVSESYRSLGGEGLKVVDGKTLLPENAKVVL